jgi:hypothetical protein
MAIPFIYGAPSFKPETARKIKPESRFLQDFILPKAPQ